MAFALKRIESIYSLNNSIAFIYMVTERINKKKEKETKRKKKPVAPFGCSYWVRKLSVVICSLLFASLRKNLLCIHLGSALRAQLLLESNS